MELPVEYKNRMLKMLGESEFESYEKALDMDRLYGLRVNNLKISNEEFEKICPFEIEKIPYIDNGYFYKQDERPALHPYYSAGLYYLQDPSAMTPANSLPIEEGDFVLDLCAAPGGKSTELGARLNGTGLIVSNDISKKRAVALLKNMELSGITNAYVLNEPANRLQESFSKTFDKIIIDAPCSGEGMFRKDPAMVGAWKEKNEDFYPTLQRDIVKSAVDMLAPGGMILYSTCTFSPLEDERILEYILSLDENLVVEDIAPYDGYVHGKLEWIEDMDRLIEDERLKSITKSVRIFPHKMDGEGHFVALIRHMGDKGNKYHMGSCDSRFVLKGNDKKLFEEFSKNVDMELDYSRFENRNSKLYYMPKYKPDMRGISYLRSGVLVGEFKKNRFEPSQAFAMSLKKEQYKCVADFSIEDDRVVRYLRGESLGVSDIESKNLKKGDFCLICVDGYPLGWAKCSNSQNGMVLKNKYFRGWISH